MSTIRDDCVYFGLNNTEVSRLHRALVESIIRALESPNNSHGIRALSDVTCAYRNLSPSFVSTLKSVQNSSHLPHARQHPAKPIITHDVSTSSATVHRPNAISEELCGMVHSQVLCQCRYLATVPFCGTSRPLIMMIFFCS